MLLTLPHASIRQKQPDQLSFLLTLFISHSIDSIRPDLFALTWVGVWGGQQEAEGSSTCVQVGRLDLVVRSSKINGREIYS